MILDISQIMIKYEKIKEKNAKKYLKISIRYPSFFERLISLEGIFPTIGCSLAYPIGAFHLLTYLSLMKNFLKFIICSSSLCSYCYN